MQRPIHLLVLLLSFQYCFAQADTLSEPEAFFSALIVQNMETSLEWYQSYLGFELLNQNEVTEIGLKQANIGRSQLRIELIELASARSAEDAIPNFTSKTRLIGFFKFGIRVSDFDRWLAHLQNLNASFHGQVVQDKLSNKRMFIIKDPDGNRIQIFEK